MKRRTMKCPQKIKRKCSATGVGCDHAVKHKENEFCKHSSRAHENCENCVEVNR